MTIVRDTRENQPWLFEGMTVGVGRSVRPVQVDTIENKLDAGDYSIAGLEHQISIERKSKIDCYQTITRSRERFIRELARLGELQFSAVIVECEWSDLMLNPPARSRAYPSSINGSIVALQQRFPKTHWWFLPGRYVASKQCYKILWRWWEDHYAI